MQSGQDKGMENVKRKLGDMEDRMRSCNKFRHSTRTRENLEEATFKEIKPENFVELKNGMNSQMDKPSPKHL